MISQSEQAGADVLWLQLFSSLTDTEKPVESTSSLSCQTFRLFSVMSDQRRNRQQERNLSEIGKRSSVWCILTTVMKEAKQPIWNECAVIHFRRVAMILLTAGARLGEQRNKGFRLITSWETVTSGTHQMSSETSSDINVWAASRQTTHSLCRFKNKNARYKKGGDVDVLHQTRPTHPNPPHLIFPFHHRKGVQSVL